MTKARISVTYVLDADIGNMPPLVVEALLEADEDFSIFELAESDGSDLDVEEVTVETIGGKK